MKPRKTHKKFSVIAGIFVLLVGAIIGGYLVLESKSGSASISQQINQILGQGKEKINACSPDPADKNKDSDNDGLKDWEEIVWKTEPCKPDTDEDGYLDGEEVSSGYHPAKSAPSDELPDQNPASPRPLPNNLTRALSQELAKKILQGEIEPLETDTLGMSSNASENSYAAVRTAIQETVSKSLEEFSLAEIDDEEIKIQSDNSPAAVEMYSRQIVSAINSQAEKTKIDQGAKFESEIQIFGAAVNDNDFDEIDKNIVFYRGIYQDIKQISVPSDFKDIHKEQLGIFWAMANIYQAIRQINADPIKASLALEKYKTVYEATIQTMNKTVNRLQEHQ